MQYQKAHRNLPVHRLVKKSLDRCESVLSQTGAIVVYTGKYTGRSPDDKYIVDTPDIHGKIDWTINTPLTQEKYAALHKKIQAYLESLDEVYIFDGFVGADPQYRLHARVISEFAYHSLFSTQLLRRPTAEELKKHVPQLTVICAPGCTADPKKDGTRSEAFIILNMKTMTVLIGGTRYAGEIKKAIFTVMNILLPAKGVLPMHCSANMGKSGDTVLFFGLSGTGKTTLSADPERHLIGDDEHGWSRNGIFNFEGGCYAKCIRLRKEHEPLIWHAIRHGSVVENVVMANDGTLDFESDKHTENTRAVYPLEHIENAVLSGIGTHPSYIIFLTCDAFGVLPPVSRLTAVQAKDYFFLGYTAKIAGTERGIKEPKLTFSRFFGGPFMSLKPHYYTRLFAEYIRRYRSSVYLVNTGWIGGAYGTGHRMPIDQTRAIVTAILCGNLDRAAYTREQFFGLSIPRRIPGVPSGILSPRNAWKDKGSYDTQAGVLSGKFQSAIKVSGSAGNR